ncbi:hypothetical protein [Pseudotenacibaculum haliotis]|uniref:Uncharacterized protein n=1 Tax=Pseudotenacibaculum haliotis TaxID=1862138 RepID=A0ABW5LTJ5_9FLAO
MKKYILLSTLLMILYSCMYAQEEKNYMNLIDKEISYVLKNSVYSNYKEKIMFDDKPGTLSGLMLLYDDKEIELRVNEFKFVDKRFDKNLKWEFDKLIKEKVGRVIVYDKKGNKLFDSDSKKQ